MKALILCYQHSLLPSTVVCYTQTCHSRSTSKAVEDLCPCSTAWGEGHSGRLHGLSHSRGPCSWWLNVDFEIPSWGNVIKSIQYCCYIPLQLDGSTRSFESKFKLAKVELLTCNQNWFTYFTHLIDASRESYFMGDSRISSFLWKIQMELLLKRGYKNKHFEIKLAWSLINVKQWLT